MTDASRYSDEEFALILERAAHLQDQADQGVTRVPGPTPDPAAEGGLSLAEVRGIAEEVGLEGRFVDEAAASLALTPAEPAPGPWGGPVRVQLGHATEHLLTDAEQGRVIESVREALNHRGEVRDVLGGVEWASVGLISTTRVTMMPAGEGSKLVVTHDASGLAVLTWVGSITSGLLASGFLLASMPNPSVVLTTTILVSGGVIGAGVARAIWSRATKSFRRRAEWLRDQLKRQISESDRSDSDGGAPTPLP